MTFYFDIRHCFSFLLNFLFCEARFFIHGHPATQLEDQAVLELRDPTACVSWVLGLQACCKWATFQPMLGPVKNKQKREEKTLSLPSPSSLSHLPVSSCLLFWGYRAGFCWFLCLHWLHWAQSLMEESPALWNAPLSHTASSCLRCPGVRRDTKSSSSLLFYFWVPGSFV